MTSLRSATALRMDRNIIYSGQGLAYISGVMFELVLGTWLAGTSIRTQYIGVVYVSMSSLNRHLGQVQVFRAFAF